MKPPKTFSDRHAAQLRAAGLRPSLALAACYAFKGDSSSSSQTIDRRIAATDNARVLNLSEGAVNFGGGGAVATVPSRVVQTNRSAPRIEYFYDDNENDYAGASWHNTPPPSSGGGGGAGAATQGISYAETGGASVVGAGNTIVFNDPAAQTNALDKISELTGATLDKLSEFAEQKAQDSSVQNKQLAYTAVVGSLVVGAIYLYTRKGR